MGTTGMPGSGGWVNSELIDSRLTNPLSDWLVQKVSGPKRPPAAPAALLPVRRLGSTVRASIMARVEPSRRSDRSPPAAMAARAAAG